MSRLIYSYLVSLDGYVADKDGGFGWARPDEEVLAFINALEAPIRSYLYGRRMYEMMKGWELDPQYAAMSDGSADFAKIWFAAEKIVYSTSLHDIATTKTRLKSSFDADEIRRLKMDAPTDIAIGGATLAAHALKAGLVDEIHAFIAPIIVGGGLAMFPPDLRLSLTLTDERRFQNGMTFVRYDVHTPY